MISLLLSLLLLLMASIIVNSIPPISRQRPFFDCLRNKKRVPQQINHFRSISASARSPNSDTKEHVFDRPIFTNYGSTDRPPGEFHLRHSLKEITNISELPPPLFYIFFFEITNNNNYTTCYYYNNGDIAAPAAATFNGSYNEEGVFHGTSRLFCDTDTGIVEKSPEWNRIELIHCRYLYKYRCYIEVLSMTTITINYNTSTYDNDDDANTAQHSIHRTERIVKWFDWSLNQKTPNNNNNNNTSTTSTYDDNNKANTAHRIHRTDKMK